MTNETTVTKHGTVESFISLGRGFLSAIRTCALVTGGIGGIIIVGMLLLLLVFPVFLFVSVLLKVVGL